MANNWAIAIGVNQYQFFQPLGCAQADAEAFKDFLVIEAGFLQQQCLLMTDTSPPLGDRLTYPTKENILLLLEDLAAACWQPQDRLWFFFSGYGINHNGQDYLMPIEGKSAQIEETGIELRTLMQSLQNAGLDTVVLLDINRAYATQANTLIGQEAIELAQELQIPTIISCQPEQFSHESTELGHGFFTAAVLEALRSGNGNTLEDLERYLSLRTPELCQHYWRPTQNPVTIIPSRKQGILPGSQTNHRITNTSAINSQEILAASLPSSSLHSHSHQLATNAIAWNGVGHGSQTSLYSSAEENSNSPPTNYSQAKQTATASTSIWKPLLWWGVSAIMVVGLLVVVFLRNQAGFRTVEISPTTTKTTNDDSETEILPVLPDSTGSTKIIKTLPSVPIPLQNNQVQSNQIKNNQVQNNQVAVLTFPTSELAKRKQALSDLEKMSLEANQASDLSLAIAKAKKIKPGDSRYEQAQTNIQIWNGMILDLAKNRAKQRKYAKAIAAAELIGQDQPNYLLAQAAIKQWRQQAKQYVANQTLLDAANGLIQPGQASTYNRAIEVAKKVSPGEPGSDQAGKFINKWSETILELAKRRASRGETKSAIGTAVLIPEGTSAYNKAQQAIQKWQNGKLQK
ncbi:caspase domain-containing protein [Pelatocladus sp. BLCC-F211]|uniref:caspase family protein n=1 Tax=Pelatocladus sp. BLCC-F211 TaxID=3342752 RepID=UPI0035B6B846